MPETESNSFHEQELPGISVVVIGRNEGARLGKCLESIRCSDYPPDKIELIYVDTDSTDNSCVLADELGAKVEVIKPCRPTAAAGRNAGLRLAHHDLVHFFDGDTVVNRAWFRKAVPLLADPNVAGVFGRRDEIDPRATIYNFWAHHDWYVPPGPALYCGGDVLFRRDVLLRLDGYDAELIAGEEQDLVCRIHARERLSVLSLDEPMVLHDMNMVGFREYWRRTVRTGYAYAEISRRYPTLLHMRRATWRNWLHLGAVATAILLAVAFCSFWPLLIWLMLVLVGVLRNGMRYRVRVGSIGDAVLYSFHHYLSKLPQAIGQGIFASKRVFGAGLVPATQYRETTGMRHGK